MIKRIKLLLCCVTVAAAECLACTSAVIGASATTDGRPLLWKNRDTSTTDNKVEYVAGRPGEHSYVGLFNAKDKTLKECWMGMNDAGFAVMNTASYNIKDDKVAASKMDKEGIVMAKALKTCVTVDDFARLLDTYPRPMGVEANFGVIDAYGNGAYFETNNHSYKRFDLKDAPGDAIIRTNYSHSGRSNEGFGFVREAAACHLLDPYIAEKSVTPEVLTEKLSRSFWHGLIERDFAESGDRWAIDQDFIPRHSSTATVVIEGCKPLKPGEKVDPELIKKQYIMWTGIGYPPCSEILPVFMREDGVDKRLRGLGKNGHSELGDVVKARREEVFPIHKGNGEKYIDLDKLFNKEGTGWVQKLVPQNLETYRKYKAERDND